MKLAKLCCQKTLYCHQTQKTFLCDDFMNNKAKQRAKTSILSRSVYNRKKKGNS